MNNAHSDATMFGFYRRRQTDDTEYLFHFTSWQVARDHILGGNKSLRFGPLRRTNDPDEFTGIGGPAVFAGYDPQQHKEHLRPAQAGLEKAATSSVFVLCFSQDDLDIHEPMDGYPSSYQMVHEGRRGFDNAPMWNHYADKHEGVCIVFEKSRLIAEFIEKIDAKRFFYGSVEYSRFLLGRNHFAGQLPFDLSTMGQSEQQYYDAARKILLDIKLQPWFEKETCWQSENEYRLMYVGNDEKEIFVNFGSAICGLILGCDFEANAHSIASALGEANEIPVRRLHWKDSKANATFPVNEFESGGAMELWEVEAKRRREERTR